ncbi:hypothetical protein KA005_42335, partial [bacterium]|nr:hypothetical protein [bacterium]
MVEPLSSEAIERAQKNFIPKESKPLSTGQTSNFKRLDVPAYLNKYGIEVVKTKSNGGSILYCLKRCIFDESHAN